MFSFYFTFSFLFSFCYCSFNFYVVAFLLLFIFLNRFLFSYLGILQRMSIIICHNLDYLGNKAFTLIMLKSKNVDGRGCIKKKEYSNHSASLTKKQMCDSSPFRIISSNESFI